MFGDSDILNGIGIVITKARKTQNYSISLQSFEDGILQSYPVFLFKKPSRANVDKPYEFDDKEKLINFIKSGPITNPITKISLSNEAISQLKNLRLTYNNEDKNNFNNILRKMKEEIKPKLEKEESIESAYSILKNIENSTFNNLDDLESVIYSNFDRSQISIYINNIRKHEKIDEFNEKVLGKNENKLSLNGEIKNWADKRFDDVISEIKNNRSNHNKDDKTNFENILK